VFKDLLDHKALQVLKDLSDRRGHKVSRGSKAQERKVHKETSDFKEPKGLLLLLQPLLVLLT